MKQEQEFEVLRLMAAKIVEATDRMTQIWDDLDYYKDHGQMRSAMPLVIKHNVEEMELPDIIAKCWNIHPTISKLKAQIKRTEEGAEKVLLEARLVEELELLKALQDIRDGVV